MLDVHLGVVLGLEHDVQVEHGAHNRVLHELLARILRIDLERLPLVLHETLQDVQDRIVYLSIVQQIT